MQQHTGLFPTDSLPNFLQVELIHRLLLKGGFILWVAPIKELFHVMSNALSLDNQTFLAWYVDSFINFFQHQNFYFFLYFSFISKRIWYKRGCVCVCGGGEFRGLGPGVVSLLGGATCRGSVDLGSVCSFKKTIKPSWCILLVKDQFFFTGDN